MPIDRKSMQVPDFPGLTETDHIELYVGNAQQAAHFYQSAFGFQPLAYAGPETGLRDRMSYVLEQGKIRLALTAPLGPTGPVADHVTRHGDGVKVLALGVKDAYAAFEETVARGARPWMEPRALSDAEGQLRLSGIFTYGDTVHLFVERGGYRGAFMPGYQRWSPRYLPAGVGLLHVDHCAGIVGLTRMNDTMKWYEETLSIGHGFAKFRINEPMEGSSPVEGKPGSPMDGKPGSLMEEYLASYGGEGVQHIAMACSDIVTTVKLLRARGVLFLPPPPEPYYQELRARAGRIAEEIRPLRELGIQLDRDEVGYLLHVFTRPVTDRPTLSFEIIQRRGTKSFSAGNFKTLFEAIERGEG